MKIYLKSITADTRTVDKWTWTAGNAGTEKTVYLTDSTDILNPVVTLDYDSAVLSSGFNYCYIPDFKRYYYIGGMSCDSGKKIIIRCTVDVLNTYKTGILSAPVNVVRSESAGVGFIPDSKYPLEKDRLHPFMKQLNSPFTKTNDGYRVVVGVFNSR